MLPRRLVSFSSEFHVLLVVKLSKIAENPKNFLKIFVFEVNKTTRAKNFPKLFISLERAFNCGTFRSNMDGLKWKGL